MPITSPADIPGLLAWYSADHLATLHADGAGLATWPDLSGNGHHLTASAPAALPTLTAAGGMAGGPAVQFSPATLNGFNLPSSLVAAVNAAAGTELACTIRTGSRGEEGMWGLQNDPDRPQSHAPYSGRMYDGALSSGRWDWPVATSTWYRYRVFSNKNVGGNPNWSAWLNGALQVNAAGVAAGGYGLRPAPVIGNSRGSGITSGTTFGGRFGAVLFYGRQLTAAERTDLEAWLTAHPSGGLLPPPAPTDLTVTAVDATSVSLSWAPPYDGYQVRVDGGPPITVGNVTAYTVTGLVPETTYTLEVRASGPGGTSAWVAVEATTLTAAPFTTVVRLGEHTWTADAGDPPELGPILPVSFGWAVPEDSLGFPAQPDPDTCPLELVTASHEDMAGVDIGTTMRVSLHANGDPRPLATFRGRVADLESAPHRLGLSWRLLGVGYVATDLGTNVGAGEWPQESGDARAARIMAEAGKPGFTADPIGNTVEARQPAPAPARELLAGLSAAAVSNVGTAYGPSRRVLIHPVTDDDGELVAANPFRGTEVVARVDAIDTLDAGLVNRATTWRRTKLLDATWVRIDHPGGPTVHGDTRGPAYPPVSVSVLDVDELADLVLDTSPGYRWLTGQPMRLELWADDGPALAVVSHWFYRDSTSHPFPWSGRAVIVNRIAQAPDGSTRYAGMLAAATIRLEHVPGVGGRLVVEFRLRPEIPSDSTVTMRWMDEPAGATWAAELADDPTGTWYDYYTTPRP